LFYKEAAVTYSKDQVGVDFILIGSGASQFDVASLAPLSRFTSGRIIMQPQFRATCEADVAELTTRLLHYMAQPVAGWEAVLRIRASKGIAITGYHGAFFIRQTDLLNLANVVPSAAYTVDLTLEELIPAPYAFVQTALLHTNTSGERRIRVLTLPLTCVASPMPCYHAIDAPTLILSLAHTGIDMLLSHGAKLETVRDELLRRTADLLRALHQTLALSGGQVQAFWLPNNMQPVPLLLLALLKSSLFRARVHPDVRAMAIAHFLSAPVSDAILALYPTLYPLHRLPSLTTSPFYLVYSLSLQFKYNINTFLCSHIRLA
jgi:protein transport protein SEC24